MPTRILALMFCLVFATVAQAADTGPKAVVQTFCDRLLDVMKHADALGYQGRVGKMGPAVADAYDMRAMTALTLGVAAKKLTPEETTQLTDAYSRYSVAVYAEQFDGWNGEAFRVEEPRASEGGQVLVPSWIVPRSGTPTEIDYLMHPVGDTWKIVDVLFAGAASQVAVRRSEFVPIFRKEGAEGLIKMLDEKTDSMGRK